VESMTTLRKYPDLFAGGELWETNGALRRDYPFSGTSVTVSEFWKWIENLLFETFVDNRRRRRSSGDRTTAEPCTTCDGG
jgi:hypothetical protein